VCGGRVPVVDGHEEESLLKYVDVAGPREEILHLVLALEGLQLGPEEGVEEVELIPLRRVVGEEGLLVEVLEVELDDVVVQQLFGLESLDVRLRESDHISANTQFT
jgi:hypothetical protein